MPCEGPDDDGWILNEIESEEKEEKEEKDHWPFSCCFGDNKKHLLHCLFFSPMSRKALTEKKRKKPFFLIS
jgi:hypothetical protein